MCGNEITWNPPSLIYKGDMKVKRLGILLLLFALTGCNRSTRDFEWPADIAQLTGQDLGAWLRTAPFSNELSQGDEDSMVLTNAAQVFPFMARFNNAVGELEYSPGNPDNPIYQQETVLYQDPDWGDLFISAALLYDVQEVFLGQYYSESGNVLFDGVDASMSRYNAALTETAVFARTDAHKTGVYWVNTAVGNYLLAFYQKDNLIFEAAIPLRTSDTIATLAKLNAVNEKLGLAVTEWQQATVSQLRPADTQETFWVDPFVGIYPEERYLLNKVQLKIKDTPFRLAPQPVKGDYFFSYDTPTGQVELFTVVKDTDHDRDAFDSAHQGLSAYGSNGRRVYYEEQETDGRVTGVAKTYFKPGQYLEINFGYPSDNLQTRARVHGVLKHVKVSGIL